MNLLNLICKQKLFLYRGSLVKILECSRRKIKKKIAKLELIVPNYCKLQTKDCYEIIKVKVNK